MKAKEYLNRVRQLDDMINAALLNRERYIEMARGLRSPRLEGDRTQGSGAGSPIEDAIEKLSEEERRINGLIDRYTHERERIADMIGQLSDGRHRQLLTLRYLDFKRLEDIACIMRRRNGAFYSYQHIRRMHGCALAEFTRKFLTKAENVL